MSDRPTFYLSEEEGKPIRAGGVIFYKKNSGEMELLLINVNGMYEDFGGKTDTMDKNIIETVSREVDEESNKIFKRKKLYNRILDSKFVYSSISKYLIYIVPLTDAEYELDVSIFGDKELHDDIPRTVEFVKLTKFLDKNFQKNLNFRLRNYSLFNILQMINNTSP